MFQDVTLENELIRIVNEKIKKDPYPEPIPYINGDAIKKELRDLKSDKIPRPRNKIEYLNRTRQLEAQIASIAEDNAIITQENAAAKKAVDDKFKLDIEAAKLDDVNIGQALCNCIDHELEKTVWYVTKDSGLTSTQQAKADKWREDMMMIPFSYTDINQAVAAYNTKKSEKPAYNLKWK